MVSMQWFKSYLENRKQFVSASGAESEIRFCELWWPQGSVLGLGPLVFLIYLNDLHCAIEAPCPLTLFC